MIGRHGLPRVGIGLDVHAFAPGRPLIVGGVEIEHEVGLAGHSDADPLTHAIIDALLGAAGRGDIGAWFPSSDDRWKGVSSLDLLAVVVRALRDDGSMIGNVDATIIAQRPRMSPHVPAMRERLARTLGLPSDSVGIKATTTDHLGALGRAEGIGAQAVALLIRTPAARALASATRAVERLRLGPRLVLRGLTFPRRGPYRPTSPS